MTRLEQIQKAIEDAYSQDPMWCEEILLAFAKENSRLREALKFYANELNWDDRIVRENDAETTKLHDGCGGKRARQALTEPSEVDAILKGGAE